MNIHKQEAKVLRKENTKLQKELVFYKNQFEKEDEETDLNVELKSELKKWKKKYKDLKDDKDEERMVEEQKWAKEQQSLEGSLEAEQHKTERLEQEIDLKNKQFEQMLNTIGIMNSINNNTNVTKHISYEGEERKPKTKKKPL